MKIPEFKPSEHFLGDTDLPCLLAKVKNSKLPSGIATRYIKSFKTDPVCEIYLRGKNPKKISAWQQQMLARLFTKAEWIPAIGPDLKRYEVNYGEHFLSCGLEPDEIKHLKKHGLLPFFTIRCVVVDDIKRKVLLSLDTSAVDEHGLSVYLSKDRWRLGDADHFYRYLHGFDGQREERKEREADTGLKHWDEQWAAIFPIPTPGTPVESDLSFLFGDWEFDRRLTARLLKAVGEPKDSIKKWLAFGGVVTKYRISKKAVVEFTTAFGKVAWRILNGQRRGSWVRIEVVRDNELGTKDADSFEFRCYHDRLAIRRRNCVYRRGANAKPKG